MSVFPLPKKPVPLPQLGVFYVPVDVSYALHALLDNGFLGAAGVRLGNPSGAIVDGVFGSITQSAVRDLQQRYRIPATGQVNPVTWEVLDMRENPYRSPLPWKQ